MKGECRSIGIDLVEYKKAKSLLLSGQTRLGRVLSDREQKHLKNSSQPEQILAAYLASKEAVFKSLNAVWMGPDNFKKIEIDLDKSDTARFKLGRGFRTLSGKKRGNLSIQRYHRYAVATCAGI